MRDLIEQVLNDYICTHSMDADLNALPLVDKLSIGQNIETGAMEIELIADAITAAIEGSQRGPTESVNKRIYISGPMTGIKHYNYPLFDKAAAFYERLGWEVISPIDLDAANGFDIRALPDDHDWSSLPEGVGVDEIIRRDFEAVMSVDAIAMLPLWSGSKGACTEYYLAAWRGIEERFYPQDIDMELAS